MNESTDDMNGDPSQMSLKQKLNFFEKSTEFQGFQRPLTNYNTLPTSYLKVKQDTSSSDNNASTSNKTNSTITNTNTPVSLRYSNKPSSIRQASYKPSSYTLNKTVSTPAKIQNVQKPTKIKQSSSESSYDSKVPRSINMKEFHEVFKDLDTFIEKELNEIQVKKRICNTNVSKFSYPLSSDKESDYESKIYDSLQKLQDEVREIKENQKMFESKIKRHESYEVSLKKKLDYTNYNEANGQILNKKIPTPPEPKKPIKHTIVDEPKKPIFVEKKDCEKETPMSKASSSTSITSEQTYFREERIQKLENEIFKEETLMMKINRVLENVRSVDDRNLPDIINIERHYLVASTRFQAALSELRRINENYEALQRSEPYNRKGKLYIREIMLEVKSSYFQRRSVSKNEYLLAIVKYGDKVYATKPVRIVNDVRVVRFTEKFSIPEAYMDFEMRLEIYGTTFWRKLGSIRETMMKKYGFVTFTLADTGNKPKRFSMIEVLQSDNVPIRDKILMKISQKITPDIKYKGNLYVKVRDVWFESSAVLTGHLLEITFKNNYNSGFARSHETMLLDLYNIDSDAAIPVDSHRVSEKPYTFLLKFNHYVDVANFYLMVAAENSDSFGEWVGAINKVLVLIK